MRNLLVFFTFFLAFTLAAQEIKYNAKTGDLEMDGFLKEVNTEALKDINAFTNKVTTKFNILKADVDKLLKDLQPGDVYMSAQVATTIGKPVTEVSTAYSKSKDKGWGQIAKELGIKPGSPEFHKLKKSMKKNGKGSESTESTGGGKGKGKGNGKGKK